MRLLVEKKGEEKKRLWKSWFTLFDLRCDKTSHFAWRRCCLPLVWVLWPLIGLEIEGNREKRHIECSEKQRKESGKCSISKLKMTDKELIDPPCCRLERNCLFIFQCNVSFFLSPHVISQPDLSESNFFFGGVFWHFSFLSSKRLSVRRKVGYLEKRTFAYMWDH